MGRGGVPLVDLNRPVSTGAGAGAVVSERPNLERKYVFHAGHARMLEAWLSATLVRDPAFAFGRISSLYYDTPQLDLYYEKRNSDFLKTKVRLRWYDNPAVTVDGVTCYMEIKRKIGALRSKERVRLELPPHALREGLFTDRTILDAPGAADPALLGRPLVPILVVEYRRHRFIDPMSGARIALDSEICARRGNPRFLPTINPALLPLGVLETKGTERELPLMLGSLARHFRRETFSKYAACCEQLMQPHGRRL